MIIKQLFAPEVRIFTVGILLILIICIIVGALSNSCSKRKIEKIEANTAILNSNARENETIANVAANSRTDANREAGNAANNRIAANSAARNAMNGNYNVSGSELDALANKYRQKF